MMTQGNNTNNTALHEEENWHQRLEVRDHQGEENNCHRQEMTDHQEEEIKHHRRDIMNLWKEGNMYF